MSTLILRAKSENIYLGLTSKFLLVPCNNVPRHKGSDCGTAMPRNTVGSQRYKVQDHNDKALAGERRVRGEPSAELMLGLGWEKPCSGSRALVSRVKAFIFILKYQMYRPTAMVVT